MVSDDLRSLLVKLERFGPNGVQMTPGGLASVCAILRSAIQDLEIIEGQPCRLIDGSAHRNADVVDFVKERGRIAMKEWLKGQGVELLPLNPDGGDAA